MNRLVNGLRVLISADTSELYVAFAKARESLLELAFVMFYHDDLCGMNDGTEGDVFI